MRLQLAQGTHHDRGTRAEVERHVQAQTNRPNRRKRSGARFPRGQPGVPFRWRISR